MRLAHLFRLHAVLAAVYALGLIVVPQRTIGLLTALPLNSVALDVARLFGAALVLITYIAWRASFLIDGESRRMIALGLFIYTTLGVVIASWGQISGTWNAFGWSSVILYLALAFGYGYFLRRKEA